MLALIILMLGAALKKNSAAVVKDYIDNLSAAYIGSTQNFNKVAEAFKFGLVSVDSLENAFLSCRNEYKRIEFLTEYFYPDFCEEYINGAPLMLVHQFDNQPVVEWPEGLQVLDELIFDTPTENKGEIVILARGVESRSLEMMAGLAKESISESILFDAFRLQLIRIFTLSVTGFDTPGSVNALPEARHALQSMMHVLAIIRTEHNWQELHTLGNTLLEGINLLNKNAGFDSFDRFLFLTSCVEPSLKSIALIVESQGISVSARSSSLNANFTGLFDPDLLNPYAFTLLQAKDDKPALRLLGKALFFDPLLSSNGKMSCGSCHQPEKFFADGLAKSNSNVIGQTVQRNSPTLINAVYADRFFHDLRAFSLEQQVTHVVFNKNEFNTAMDEIVNRLSQTRHYQKKFKKTFGKSGVNGENINAALTSYVLSLKGFNSHFDSMVRYNANLSDSLIVQGFNLFNGKAGCATCHFSPTFSGLVPPRFNKNESEILGVLESPKGWKRVLDADSGRMNNGISNEASWVFERSFKTPSLRNVEKTAPYFHNGAYKTLEEVVDFYDHGGGAGLGIAVKNQTLPSDSLHLSLQEKSALVAFMKSLTDGYLPK